MKFMKDPTCTTVTYTDHRCPEFDTTWQPWELQDKSNQRLQVQEQTAIWCHLSLTARQLGVSSENSLTVNHLHPFAFAGHTFKIIFTLNNIERVSISTINMQMYTAPTKKDAAQYRMTNDSWTCIKSHDGALDTVAEAQVELDAAELLEHGQLGPAKMATWVAKQVLIRYILRLFQHL